MNQNRKPVGGFGAILRQRCPGCCEASLFRTWTETHKVCPRCGLLIEREEGYFLGAMYFSYALAIVFLMAAMLIWHLILPDAELDRLALLASLTFVPFVLPAYRYSRVLWVYFDRWAWPQSRPRDGVRDCDGADGRVR